ncbi:MAG: A/G-specific adenine glycosylase, partial [Natronomonas sp.]
MSEAATERFEDVDLPAVQSALLAWYREDHRSFPWRETDDP